jgi:hypothetical protein
MAETGRVEPNAEELRQALVDYADHQSWRCGHPDRYPWEPDCPCGLTAVLRRFNIEVTP